MRALIGIKRINCEIVYIDAGHIPGHLLEKVENFSVPILEVPGATPEEISSVMQESADIVRYLDRFDGQALFDRYDISQKLQQWLLTLIPALLVVGDIRCQREGLLQLPSLGKVLDRYHALVEHSKYDQLLFMH